MEELKNELIRQFDDLTMEKEKKNEKLEKWINSTPDSYRGDDGRMEIWKIGHPQFHHSNILLSD